MSKVRYQLIVSGKVQGVWFRKSTKDEADKVGLTGFVKNIEDGTVYIEAEGEEAVIQKFIFWCGNGPDLAIVRGIEAKTIPVVGSQSFEIV